MSKESSKRIDRWLRLAVTTALVLTVLHVWVGPMSMSREARAQIPDAGTQRVALANELKETNKLLQQILKTLQSGTLTVEIKNTADKKAAGKVRGK